MLLHADRHVGCFDCTSCIFGEARSIIKGFKLNLPHKIFMLLLNSHARGTVLHLPHIIFMFELMLRHAHDVVNRDCAASCKSVLIASN